MDIFPLSLVLPWAKALHLSKVGSPKAGTLRIEHSRVDTVVDHRSHVGRWWMSAPFPMRQVRKATGSNLSHSTQLFMTLLVGTIIGLAFAWQIGQFPGSACRCCRESFVSVSWGKFGVYAPSRHGSNARKRLYFSGCGRFPSLTDHEGGYWVFGYLL